MLPWTWAIAYRRFNQGMLIRFGHSRSVGIGTAVRLITNLLILSIGYILHSIPGIIVATTAVAVGVTSEALYIALRIRPVVRTQLNKAELIDPPMSYQSFFKFYIPLVLTSLLTFLIQPIGSAAISRMPQPLESLAVWPVMTGLLFLLRSMGIAYNEVVISIIHLENSYHNLIRFTRLLVLALTSLILMIALSPISMFWFTKFSGLSNELTSLAVSALWFAILMPGLSVLQSWFQGAILDYGKTRGITEAVIIFLCTVSILLMVGVLWKEVPGLYIAIIAYSTGMGTQAFWLWYRSRPAFQIIKSRDC
jgi:hypothetical protein